MPDFCANLAKRSSGKEGSNKMYQVAQNPPQRHFVIFKYGVPLLVCLVITLAENRKCQAISAVQKMALHKMDA